MKRILLAITCLVFLASCYGPKTLQNQLNTSAYTFAYLHDPPSVDDKLDVSISAEVNDLSNTSDKVIVEKEDAQFFYFVVGNKYDYNFVVNWGKKCGKPRLNRFIKDSFEEESRRSGVYTIEDSTAVKKYKAVIDILEVDAQTKYYTYGVSVLGSEKREVDITPSVGNLKLKLSLLDMEGKLLLAKEFKSTKKSGYVKSSVNSIGLANKNMMQNMTESLSACIKHNITRMVAEVNTMLQ